MHILDMSVNTSTPWPRTVLHVGYLRFGSTQGQLTFYGDDKVRKVFPCPTSSAFSAQY